MVVEGVVVERKKGVHEQARLGRRVAAAEREPDEPGVDDLAGEGGGEGQGGAGEAEFEGEEEDAVDELGGEALEGGEGVRSRHLDGIFLLLSIRGTKSAACLFVCFEGKVYIYMYEG